ncbi:MAG: TIGR04086 family membrane protein [Desulfitobacteriaceae bacterium]|nr:TIGR04086 family membrane protein [Desulfitobacteriaceae bacterium]MDI6912830.1 TIGR04086 family membrane protein [Desulfitobacteriaceae bacterium]
MSKSFQFSLAFKGIIVAAVLALFLALAYGLLLSLTSLPESSLAITVIVLVSIFVSAFLVAYQAGVKGLYYGLFVSFGFIFLLLLISAVFIDTPPSWLKVGERSIFSLVAGGCGGILGVLVRR